MAIIILLLSILSPTLCSIDYFDILDINKAKHMIERNEIEEKFHQKINPILQSRKMWEDDNLLSQYTLLLEARDCLDNVDCIAEHKKSGKQWDYYEGGKHTVPDGYWEGLEILNPRTFREKVMNSEEHWLIVFSSPTDDYTYTLRNVLLDFRYIAGPSIKLAYVDCPIEAYNICTGGPATPSLMFWPRKLYFEGETNLFNIAKFYYTYSDVDIKNYKPIDVLPAVNATKKSIVLIDSTSVGLDYIELKTIIALLSSYLNIGIIDCQTYYKDCYKYDKEAVAISAIWLPYTDPSEVSGEYFTQYMMKIKSQGKAEDFIGEILKEVSSTETNELEFTHTDSRMLHKTILKAKHGKIPPIVVYLGAGAPTLRILALKRYLYPYELHSLECSHLELYCFRYKADEDNPRFLAVKKGGFEYINTRDSIFDRVKSFLSSKSSKLATLRSEDLYSLLGEGPLNNTLIQYYNSSKYDMRYNGPLHELGYINMRKAANLLMEMFGTKMYTVDCSLHDDICTANKIGESEVIHYILTNKILTEITEPVPADDYVSFVQDSLKKDILVEELVPPDTAAGAEEIKQAFDKFHSEL